MERENNEDLGSSLIRTLGSSELPEVLQDFTELALDSVLLDGLAKDIPFVGTVVRLGKAAFTVRDYFLIKKVLIFLHEVSKTTYEERQAFVGKVKSNSKYEQRVGETVLMLLDRLDHLDKSQMVAQVLCACIREEISYIEFLRISTAIERAFIEDLNALLDYFSCEEITPEVRRRRSRTTRNLYTSDFADFYVLTEKQADEAGLEYPQIYHFSRYATKFARIILEDRFQEGRG